MSFVSVVFLLEVALLLAVVAYLVVARVRNDRLALRRRVLVNLTSGTAVRGILWRRRGRLLVIRDGMLLEPRVEPVALDGEVLLDRDRIAWVQVDGDPAGGR